MPRGSKNKIRLDFSGVNNYLAKLEAIGSDATKKALTIAMKASQQVVRKSVIEAMKPHNQTGHTVSTAVSDAPVKWSGNIGWIPVGFDLLDFEEGGSGLVSIYLMYGTTVYGQPHIPPDRKLYNAVYGSAVLRKCRQLQERAFLEYVERVMK